MVRAVLVLAGAMLLLTACGDPGPARIPSYRYLEQNAPSNRDYQPQNSLPP